MTPWELAGATEHSHQRAVFAWANCAALYGFQVADDPRGYMLDTRPPVEQWRAVPVLSRLFAIHNQGHGSAIRGAKAKAEGVKAGVLDMMLPVPKFIHWATCKHGLFIELKHPSLKPKSETAKGGVSDEQAEWLNYLVGAGYSCHVCYGWEEAAKAIREYLT